MKFSQKILQILDRKEKIKFSGLALAVLLMGFLEVVGVASILPFMQLAATPNAIEKNKWLNMAYQFFGFTNEQQMLIYFGIAILIIIAFTNLFAIFTVWLQYKYSWEVAHNLSIRLLGNYIHKPYPFFLKTNTSQLNAYVIAEVNNLTGGILIPLIEVFSRSFIALIIFGLLLWIDTKIALIMFGTLGGAYGLIFLAQKNFLKKIGHHRMDMNLLRYQSLKELLDGIKTVLAYNKQYFFYSRYHHASKEFTEVQPKYNLMLAAPRYALELLAFGSILAVTIYFFLDPRYAQQAIPRLSLYAVAGYRLMPALQKSFAAAVKIRHNLPVLERLYKELPSKLQLTKQEDLHQEKLPFKKKITFNKVNFKYDASEYLVINNFNLTIAKGETIAFVGTTGSGKTTLVDLFVGLLQPNQGSIKIDNTSLNKENVGNWRNQLAYVPQEVFLFDDSVVRNIVLHQGEQEVDYQRLEVATKIAHIHDFIVEELPEGFDTAIGERGVRLSGGQRQRLGLARAIYANPDVLILDEATSALDSITEKKIINALKELPKNMTIIVIAHRLSTVRHADQIYILEKGKIVDQGSYQLLIESNTAFREMVKLS